MTWATLFPLLLAHAVLLALSAIFSGGETVLFSLTHADRLRLRRLSPRGAAAAAALLARPRRLLILILLLNVSVNAAYFVVSSLTARRFEHGAVSVAFGIASVLTMILFAEVIPKSLGTVHRVRLGAVIAPILVIAARLLDPVTGIFEGAILRPLSRLFRPAGAGEANAISVEELSSLLESGAGRGVIDEDEQQLLSDVVALGTVRVREVMTPRVDLCWLAASAGADKLVDLVRTTGHTKFPLCRVTPDAGVIGMVHAKRYLAARAAGALGTRVAPAQWADPALFIPDRARLDQLLEQFRSKRAHVAVCVDELGAVTGLVEVEDVVRLLVRPVAEAGSVDAPRVAMVGPGRWRVPGRLGIRQWAEFFGPDWAAPRDRRVTTVAGFMLSALGRVPRVGDEVRVGNIRLRVESMSGRMVESIGVQIGEEGGP